MVLVVPISVPTYVPFGALLLVVCDDTSLVLLDAEFMASFMLAQADTVVVIVMSKQANVKILGKYFLNIFKP
jgi:hypothetical protein